jgi:type I restriction enzyme S subunit
MRPVEIRNYVASDSAKFRKTAERLGGLSNMAPGFPLEVNGIQIRTSEALYQACRFPHLPDVQRMIIEETSPMTAKMKSKPYRDRSRPDWDVVRARIMRWCLRVKLAQNWERFGALLLETDGHPIVEESGKDDFWGAIPSADGHLVGRNVLGRLLMELRELLRAADTESLRRVEPPRVPRCLLYGEPVGIVDRPAKLVAAARGPQSLLTARG